METVLDGLEKRPKQDYQMEACWLFGEEHHPERSPAL